MNLKKSLVLAALLLFATLANAQNDVFCPFAGVWERNDKSGFAFDYSEQGKPRCRMVIDGVDDTAFDIAVVDNHVFIDFPRGKEYRSGDTVAKHLLYIGTLNEDYMEMECIELEEIHSPVEYEVLVNDDSKTYLFHRTQKKTCPPPIIPKFENDTICYPESEALIYFVEAFDLFNRNDTLSHLEAKYKFKRAIAKADDLLQKEGAEYDYRLIKGLSYYYLMFLEQTDSAKKECAQKTIFFMPGKKILMPEILIAKTGYYELIEKEDFVQYFFGLCDIIREWELMDSLDERSRDLLKSTLGSRADCFTKIKKIDFRDEDLKRALSIEGGELSRNPNIDSSCYIGLSYDYAVRGGMAQDSGYLEEAKELYRKSLSYFDQARIMKLDSAAQAWSLYPMVCAYKELYGEFEPLPIELEFVTDSIVDFCYKNSSGLSFMDEWFAGITMQRLLEQNRYDSLFAFYDNIKNNFRFDTYVNYVHLAALASLNYVVEDLDALARMSRAIKGEEEWFDKEIRYLTGRLSMDNGDFDRAYDDLLGNERIVSDTTLHLPIFLAFLLDEKADTPEFGIEMCDSLLALGIDSSSILCYRGVFFLRNSKINKSNRLRLANEDFRNSIAIMNRQGDISGMPYAYFWLGMIDSALYWTNQLLAGNDTTFAYFCAADIHSLLGNYDLARSYVKQTLELYNTPYIRSVLLYDADLHPIKDYVKTLCDEYAKDDTLTVRHLRFRTQTTEIPCWFSPEGSLYISCEIGGITIDSMKVDNGADDFIISRQLANKLAAEGKVKPLGYYQNNAANGSIMNNKYIILSSITLGTITLRNVVAAIADDNSKIPFLLGQSVLANFIMEVNPFKAQITLTKLDEIRE